MSLANFCKEDYKYFLGAKGRLCALFTSVASRCAARFATHPSQVSHCLLDGWESLRGAGPKPHLPLGHTASLNHLHPNFGRRFGSVDHTTVSFQQHISNE